MLRDCGFHNVDADATGDSYHSRLSILLKHGLQTSGSLSYLHLLT